MIDRECQHFEQVISVVKCIVITGVKFLRSKGGFSLLLALKEDVVAVDLLFGKCGATMNFFNEVWYFF